MSCVPDWWVVLIILATLCGVLGAINIQRVHFCAGLRCVKCSQTLQLLSFQRVLFSPCVFIYFRLAGGADCPGHAMRRAGSHLRVHLLHAHQPAFRARETLRRAAHAPPRARRRPRGQDRAHAHAPLPLQEVSALFLNEVVRVLKFTLVPV